MRLPALAGLVVALATAACFSPSYDHPTCGPGGTCPGGFACNAVTNACEVVRNDAAVDDDHPPADAACLAACLPGDMLRDCSGNIASCDRGCVTTPDPHCVAIVPSNSIDLAVVAGTNSYTVPGGAVVTANTDTGLIMFGSLTVRQAGGGVQAGIYYEAQSATMSVFGFGGVNVQAGAVIHFVGSRAVVVAAGGDITVSGVLDLRDPVASRELPGAGGGRGATLGQPAVGCSAGGDGVMGSVLGSGGGGGGYGGGGGSGAPSDGGVGGMPGGVCGTPTITPLIGGSGGGRSGGTSGVASGGGGGGAIQLVATGIITVDGMIDAGGRGGAQQAAGGGAGGGGSGGAILLEAPTVTVVTGKLVANGGAGGGSTSPGGDGTPTNSGAAGGATAPCTGGGGGAYFSSATSGASCGAGGGGSVGRIRVNASSFNSNPDAGVQSPQPTTGTPMYQ